jgi:hypothetical protein
MKKALRAIYCFFVFGVFAFSNANAQKLFVEGELLYAITISQNHPEQKTPNNIQGTLSIKQKGHAVLKELLLKNGFKSTKLFLGQAKPSYSFVLIGEQNFALKSDEESLRNTLLKCKELTLEPLPTDIKSIAGFKTERGKILCNDRKPIVIHYTQEWQTNNPLLFEEFSSFKSLPLAFEINNEDGSLIRFELINIESKPMENVVFQIPSGYKIISQEEYKVWQH